MSAIFSLFFVSFNEVLFATRTALDSITVSITFNLFWAKVVPVSVISKIASTSSGGFASVAPSERNICTFLFSPTRSQGVIIIGEISPKYFLYAEFSLICAEAVVRYSVDILSGFLLAANSPINSVKLFDSRCSGTAKFTVDIMNYQRNFYNLIYI